MFVNNAIKKTCQIKSAKKTDLISGCSRNNHLLGLQGKSNEDKENRPSRLLVDLAGIIKKQTDKLSVNDKTLFVLP